MLVSVVQYLSDAFDLKVGEDDMTRWLSTDQGGAVVRVQGREVGEQQAGRQAASHTRPAAADMGLADEGLLCPLHLELPSLSLWRMVGGEQDASEALARAARDDVMPWFYR